MPSFNFLFPNPTPFLNQIFHHLQEDQVDVSSYELDHLCYRVESIERYAELKETCSDLGSLLTETLINGRHISTFKLHQPILYQNRTIALLELPSPKPGSPYAEGFEHVEFVIDEGLDRFVARYPQLAFDTKGMKKAINPDVRLAYGPLSVKFHCHNLEYVIRYLD